MNLGSENEQSDSQKAILENNLDPEITVKESVPNKNIPPYKLFSQQSIYLGTFFAGPPAFTYFLYRNYKNLGQIRKAWLIVVYGILGVIAITALLVMVETKFRILLPAQYIAPIYYGLAVGLYQATQKQLVARHKDSGGVFYSGKRVLLISLASIAFTVALIAGILLNDAKANKTSLVQQVEITYGPYDQTSYLRLSDQITQNDKDALKVNDIIKTASSEDYISALDSGIIKFRQNLDIAKQINSIDNLPNALLEYNQKIITYINLRIQEFELRKKEEQEQSDKYDPELQTITKQINDMLVQLGG